MKLAYSGRRADLVAVALSYDEDYRYGLQTPFSENLSRMWAGGMWHVDPTHNTFITTGNAGSESTAAEVTLFYNGGKSKYRIEKMLSSGQQLWLDVGRLIHDQVPDSDGRTLAPDTMTGSYELRDLDHATVGELYEGKLIIDKTYGHAAYGCGTCCGDGVPTLLPSPFGGPPDINNTDVMQSLEQCTGDLIDLADDAYNWNSTNTAVATLPTKVLHTVAVGSASGSGTVYVQADHPAPRCPMAYYSPSQQVVVAKLTCTSSVTLGGTATCTATGPSGSTFSNWKFTDGSNNTVTSTSTSSTWSGVMVTGGTVSVTVTSSGKSASPTAQIRVNNRTNFAFSAVSPTAENNGFSGDGCTVNVPSPPAKTGDAVGAFCLAQYFSLNTAVVGDGGPNNGYSYVTSISSSSGSSTTSYFYVISPDLENSSSTFYKAQCGNYNSQTNPNGFISGANLLTDTTRHESGIVQSHYENYVVVQNTSTNNLGTVAEHMTGLESGQALATSVTSALNHNLQTITSATQVEPCSVQQDASCNFQGSSIFNRTNHAIEAIYAPKNRYRPDHCGVRQPAIYTCSRPNHPCA